MKVLVTGATGFVGSHAALALDRAGHQLRVLVRSESKAERVLGARGVRYEAVVGDMTDRASVERALDGCEAVLHAAATVFGGPEAIASNVAGVRHVLGAAAERQLDPILYVSTIVAMYPPPGERVTVEDPIASLKTSYGRSKSEGERLARELQAGGAPVVILYPAGVYGPDDPGVGETSKGLRDAIRYGWPVPATGGVSMVDVRDLAQLIVAALKSGQGPRRFMCGGHFLRWEDKASLCEQLTGTRMRRFRTPGWLLLLAGSLIDLAKRVRSFDYPLTREAADLMIHMKPCDSDATRRELGVEFRPPEETLADHIRWLHRIGELDDAQVGRLAQA